MQAVCACTARGIDNNNHDTKAIRKVPNIVMLGTYHGMQVDHVIVIASAVGPADAIGSVI